MRTRKILHIFSVIDTPLAFFDGQFLFLSERGFDIIVIASPSDKAEEFARRNNSFFCPVSILRTIAPRADMRAVVTISRFIKQNHIDVVIGHTPKGALIAMIAAVLAGAKKRVYYRHGLVYTTASGFKRFVLKNEERFVGALATDVINVSKSLSLLAIKDSLNNPKKQVCFGKGTCGGIDAKNLFNPRLLDNQMIDDLRGKLHLYNYNFVFGFVGRICRDKGIKELYEGYKLFRCRNLARYSKLLIVGKLDGRDSLAKDTIEQLVMDPDVIMTGEIEKQEMPYYYSLMDVFVFPSYREGFGMSVIEASAMEKPVLVSRSHGCVDSIEEGITGLYIDITAEGICEGMESLQDLNKRRSLGLAGRERVLNDFDQSVLWPQIADYYESLIDPQ